MTQDGRSSPLPLNQPELFQALLDSSSEAITIADRNGKFLVFNRAAERLAGAAPTTERHDFDATVESWLEHFGMFEPDEVTPIQHENIPLYRAVHGETVKDFPLFLRNGHIPKGIHLSVSASPLRDAAGELCGGIVIFHDMTDRREAEAERKSAERALAESKNRHVRDVIRAQEEICERIARDLHDGVAQDVAGFAYMAQTLRSRLDKLDLGSEVGTAASVTDGASAHGNASARVGADPGAGATDDAPSQNRAPETRELAATLADGLRVAVDHVRQISYGLHPFEVRADGLRGAIEHHLEQTRWMHPAVKFQFTWSGPMLEQAAHEAQVNAYRIVQEAVANSIRHGNPSSVQVTVNHANAGLTLTVIDDGDGIDPKSERTGIGINTMRERADLMGGTFEVESGERGTAIVVQLPIEEDAADPRGR